MANLAHLNTLTVEEAHAAFLRCCASRHWADAMTTRRPFSKDVEIYLAAEEIWANLDRADWLEAFAAHPRIGDLEALRKKFATTADWCAAEQAGVLGTGADVLQALAEGNRQYEERFGYLFIVCATGKTAQQILKILQERLANSHADELAIAAREQAKITRLRLEKL
jgi:2-oxo-4-hydroxy-4-carboxy-5-ureidoimidazoline decarboxylase